MALLALLSAAARGEDLCPTVLVEGPDLGLTVVERRLVCGDEESEGWREVPRGQARRFLEAFLQTRARLHPRFAERGKALVVDGGPVTKISRLEGDGLPPGIDLSKKRKVRGRPLTPAALDRVKQDLVAELENAGWACPEVVMSADADSGTVTARFAGGTIARPDPIEQPALPGIDPGIFRRFEAFDRTRAIDRSLLDLTSRRVVNEALFLNSYYDVSCSSAGVRVVHRVSAAPPRLFRTGIGVDTEGLVRFRARWSHTRIGWRASTADVTVAASKREQSADAQSRLYPSPASRVYVLPRAQAARSDEPRYETVSSQLSVMPGLSWDDHSTRVEARAGPALEYADTRRGIGPAESYFQSFNTHAEIQSHVFEYWLRDPREGFRAEFDSASRVSKLASSVTAHRVRAGGEGLWNVGGFDPPLAVLGMRGWAATTLTGDYAAARAELPPAMRVFIGGDADFRGVGPGELGGEEGFLTGIYQGFEARAVDVLPAGIQPVVFLDVAMAGERPLSLDPDVYYAPGFGVRWATFLGAFRMTFARSLLWRRDPATAPGRRHWQFFFSYGREF